MIVQHTSLYWGAAVIPLHLPLPEYDYKEFLRRCNEYEWSYTYACMYLHLEKTGTQMGVQDPVKQWREKYEQVWKNTHYVSVVSYPCDPSM